MSKFKSMREIKDLSAKKVLLKLDLNLSLDNNGQINENSTMRIESILPTLDYLIDKNAKIVIISYLGRPKAEFVEKLKMDPIARILSKYLNKEVKKLDSCRAEDIKEDIEAMNNADIILLENIRFYKEEEEDDEKMAKALAELFDIYINDSFSNAHRKHMSSSAITKFLPSYIGFKFQEEIENLSDILNTHLDNTLLILGGAKIKTKLSLIAKLQNKFKYILLGGVMANTFLKARNFKIGKSIFEKDCLKNAHELDSNQIILPQDVLVSKGLNLNLDAQNKNVDNLEVDDVILDIGFRTIELFKNYIDKADLILWNGPMGYFELNKFKNGTQELIIKMADSKSKVYTGGGETITILNEMQMIQDFDFVSTGGGAMLEFLAGNTLAALKALEDNVLN